MTAATGSADSDSMGQAEGVGLPVGLVTFLLTDVEASTELWRSDADRASELMKQVSGVIASAVGDHGGSMPVEQGEGDSAVAAFERPDRALSAALAIQRSFGDADCRVRIGVHTGLAELVDESTYGGAGIIRAARIRDLCRGGEILVSQATFAVAGDLLPAGAHLKEVGSADLKGFEGSETLYRMEHPDLADLGPIRLGAGSGLPHYPTRLVGRDAELDELIGLLETSAVLTITGAGGSGKTRMAHAVAQAADGGPGGRAVWVELTAVSDPSDVVPRTLEALGQIEATEKAPIDQLIGYLAEHAVLVVVDNCEHLLDAVAELASAVVSAGKGRLLATSREPLGVSGEVTWRIPSLDVPSEADTSAETIEACSSVVLFVDHARSTGEFELDDEVAPAVARICRRLDGIPLALELAAARVRSMSVADLADRLDDRFAVLTSGTRGVLERQRTLLASVQWSYDLLDDSDRLLLRRLCVFRAPFTLQAAEMVGTEPGQSPIATLDGITRLVDKSLVQHLGGRYSMLETIRAYAADRATEADELADTRDRHLEWAIRRTTGWGFPRDPSAGADVESLMAEHSDLAAAMDWAWRRRPDQAHLLAQPMSIRWTETGSFGEARRLIARATSEFGPGTAEWVEFLAAISLIVVAGGVIDWLGPAHEALGRLPDVDAAARARVEQATAVLSIFGGNVAALDDLRRAGAASREAGDELGAVSALAFDAFALASLAKIDQVRPIIEWLDAHGQPTGNWWVFDLVRAVVASGDGDLATAREYVDPLVAKGLPIPCISAAYIAWSYRDAELATMISTAIAERSLDGWYAEARPLATAVVATLQGDYDTARDAFVGTDRGLLDHWAFCTLQAADMDLYLGDTDSARQRMAEVADVVQGAELTDTRATLAILQAMVAIADGEPSTAVDRAAIAVTLTSSVGYRIALASSLQAFAIALDAASPRSPEAARILGAADAFADAAGSHWHGPSLDEHLEELHERIDLDNYHAGRELDLTEAIELARRVDSN